MNRILESRIGQYAVLAAAVLVTRVLFRTKLLYDLDSVNFAIRRDGVPTARARLLPIHRVGAAVFSRLAGCEQRLGGD